MAQKNHTTNLTELLLQCVAQPDPMLSCVGVGRSRPYFVGSI